MSRYPRLIWNLNGVRENAARVVERCASLGVKVCAVAKGVLADIAVARAMLEGGCVSFADSRMRNLISLKRNFPDKERMLLRIPMKSEIEDAIRNATCSLVSMPESVVALEARCRAMKTTHKVLLMFDLGDRREGITDLELEGFAEILKKTSRVTLQGVGVNFGCFAGILPSSLALHRLCAAKDALERFLGYEVPVCSGGSTSSLMLVEQGELPKGVNELRIGEAILLGQDVTWQRTIPWLSQDTVSLEAEVIEVRRRPSVPEGEVGADAFGNVPALDDRGSRLRAIVALGRQDLPIESLRPADAGVEILGASSDHTILDVENMKISPWWGDILRFSVGYGAMMGLMTSPYVRKEYF